MIGMPRDTFLVHGVIDVGHDVIELILAVGPGLMEPIVGVRQRLATSIGQCIKSVLRRACVIIFTSAFLFE